jgi:4-amino-4-deoxy-L-arabinose transferase-like glycosyltransferase
MTIMLEIDIYEKDKRKFEWFYPAAITLIFLIIISYLAFEHYQYVFNPDGLFYLNTGKQILAGNGENVSVNNAPIGGPIIYALFDNLIDEGFLTLKLFSIICGTGIIFISYFIIRNIFSFKIALLGQMFFAISPALQTRAVLATNELLALLLIFSGIYFLTKENIQRNNLIYAAVLLGIATDIRYQAIFVVIPFVIFLMFNSKDFKKNIKNVILFSTIFLMCILPIFAYNLSTHGTILDTDYSFYNKLDPRHDSPEKIDVENNDISEIYSNNDITIENYLINLSYYNSNLLFNFFANNAISVIPIIPYISIIPVFVGFLGVIYKKINKKLALQSLIILLITLTLVLIFGELKFHFFLIIAAPVVFLGLMTLKHIQKNLIPIIILTPIYFILTSIVPLDRPDQFFSIWITISILCSIFFLSVIPKILTPLIKKQKIITVITISFVCLVIVSNMGFSYKIFEIYLYGTTNEGLEKELEKVFQEKKVYQQVGYEMKQISDILKQEPNIEESYIMSSSGVYSYHTDAKMVYALFTEGKKGDSIIQYITRENWSPFDLYFSNIVSLPADKFDRNNPLPNYLIYTPMNMDTIDQKRKENTQVLELQVLAEPKNSRIPENFELIFKSENTGTVVYKINWDKID